MRRREPERLQEAQFKAELYKPRRPTYDVPGALNLFEPLLWLLADMLLEARRVARRR